MLLNVVGAAILAFGLYQIHSISDVTEGGVLGLTLLFQHWFGLSPSISGFVLNAACYLFGYKTLGKPFIRNSIIAGTCFSLFYALFEQTPRLWPQIGQHPLLAAVGGAFFVGFGVGLCVRNNGAPTGDDALAMGLSRRIGNGPVENSKNQNPMDLSGQRLDRAVAFPILYSPAAHPVFTAHRRSVRPVDRPDRIVRQKHTEKRRRK